MMYWFAVLLRCVWGMLADGLRNERPRLVPVPVGRACGPRRALRSGIGDLNSGGMTFHPALEEFGGPAACPGSTLGSDLIGQARPFTESLGCRLGSFRPLPFRFTPHAASRRRGG